jgi:hypothetical protein
MRFHKSRTRIWSSQRWWIVTVMLVAYFVGWLGLLPSPEFMAKLGLRLSSERFPCETGHCGCSSPEQCWTICACQTMAQKIDWAVREGVPVPSYANIDGALVLASEVHSGSEAETAAASCCAALAVRDESPSERGVVDERSKESRPPSLSPFGCRGVNALVAFMLPPTTPFASPVILDDLTPAHHRPAFVAMPASRILDIATPPPRHGAA